MLRSLRYADLLLEQVQGAFRIINVAVDRHLRDEPEAESESEKVAQAVTWFAYWFFADRRPSLEELGGLFDSHVLPKARVIAEKYGKLSEAALQYGIPPEPFLQACSLINALADGLVKTQGQSLADHYRDALRILHELGIGGTAAHTAAHGAVHRLEEAATQKLLSEAKALEPPDALRLLHSIGNTIDRCQQRIAAFHSKWGGRRPEADLSIQERQEFTADSEDVFVNQLENDVALTQRAAVMERIVELTKTHGLDSAPLANWIRFMRRVGEMEEQQDETKEQFRARVKGLERECNLDMTEANAVLESMRRKVMPNKSKHVPDVRPFTIADKQFLKSLRDGIVRAPRSYASGVRYIFRRFNMRQQHRAKLDEWCDYKRVTGTEPADLPKPRRERPTPLRVLGPAFTAFETEGIATGDDDLRPFNDDAARAVLVITWLLTDKQAGQAPVGQAIRSLGAPRRRA
jgi:hypothetical protein